MTSYKKLFRFPLQLVITGKSKSGKSHLLRKKIIPAIIDDYEAIFIISPTADLDLGWKKLKNKSKKYKEKIVLIQEFTDETLQETLELCGENRKISNDNDVPEEEQPKYLFVMDDVSDILSQSKKDFFSRMSIKGRHYNCSYILTSHKWNIVNRMIRTNCVNKIFFRITTNNELKSILEDNETYFVKQPELEEIIVNNTGAYKSLLIESDCDSDNYYKIQADGDIVKLKI
jgi:hypothetical protein